MPDWSYRTLLRPALFTLSAENARDLTITAISTLAALPGGRLLIETFGHLAPPAELATVLAEVPVRSPIGLGVGIDTIGRAARAWESLGFGFIEVGPVTALPITAPDPVARDLQTQDIILPSLPVNPGLDTVRASLIRVLPLKVPLAVRLAHAPAAGPGDAAREQRGLASRLAPHATLFTLDWTRVLGARAWSTEDWCTYLAAIDPRDEATWAGRPVLVVIPPEADPSILRSLLPRAIESGVRGIVVADGLPLPDGRRQVGPRTLPTEVATVRTVRAVLGDTVCIVAAGGITEPADALALLEAGANAIQVASGLVYAGPALPRRIGETILAVRAPARIARLPKVSVDTRQAGPVNDSDSGADGAVRSLPARRVYPSGHEDWPWIAVLGAGMVVAGALAWLVAVIRVVLPYDEAFLGLSRAQMERANPHLLSFMAHDRVTLAGIMISIGLIYGGLALGPLRHGHRWARHAFFASAVVGFSSFALVLGYRYVDPLHAIAALALLPFLLLAVRGRSRHPTTPHADLHNDRAWLRAQWGQLALVTLGVGFVVGGMTIATVGVTDVFVHEDLSYLHTTAAALRAANPHLVPLVAHDRAGFGGALVSDGVAFLLTALWGIRRGARWVWFTLLLAGLPGFVATISIHLAVGYDNPLHLAPVGLALILWALGLTLSRAYCCDRAELGIWASR